MNEPLKLFSSLRVFSCTEFSLGYIRNYQVIIRQLFMPDALCKQLPFKLPVIIIGTGDGGIQI